MVRGGSKITETYKFLEWESLVEIVSTQCEGILNLSRGSRLNFGEKPKKNTVGVLYTKHNFPDVPVFANSPT